MELHVRKDSHFIQDSRWYECLDRYQSFLRKAAQNDNVTLVHVNRDYPEKQAAVGSFISFREDMNSVLSDVV